MTDQTNQTVKQPKPKRKALSKGQKTHVRKQKADARREGTVYRPGS